MKFFVQKLLNDLKLILAILLVINYYYLLLWLEIDFLAILPVGVIGGFYLGTSLVDIKRRRIKK